MKGAFDVHHHAEMQQRGRSGSYVCAAARANPIYFHTIYDLILDGKIQRVNSAII